MVNKLNSIIGRNIQKRRIELDLSQDELAKRVGYKDRSSITKIEKGGTDLTQSRIIAIAKVLRTTPNKLMESSSSPSKISNLFTGSYEEVPVIGTIACGTPILAEQNIEGTAHMAGNIRADFALNIKGDSMDNAEIHNGDIVFIRQQEEVEDGEIAAVLIDEEATLKRFYRHGRAIELRPENPKYRSMIFTEDNCNSFKILGKAVACQHCFE